MQVGGLVAAYFKLTYQRARPAQVWTSVTPLIPTPAHPSYPGGHGLQAHLIAECVKAAVPAMAIACDTLAARIANNRILAGVHYPSDNAASVRICPNVFTILKNVAFFSDLMTKAANEWVGANSIEAPPLPTPIGG
jgi:acid phosphatase (class A)